MPSYHAGAQQAGGTAGSKGFVADLRRLEIPKEIKYYRPEAGPLVKLSQGPNGLKRWNAGGNHEFKVFEKEPHGLWTAIDNTGAAYTSGTTTIDVDSTAHLRKGYILYAMATGELIEISSVTDANTLVVVRGVGTTAAAAGSVANDAVLVVLSSVNAELDEIPDILLIQPTKITNYTQIVRTPLGASRRAIKAMLTAGKTMPDLRKEIWVQHQIQIAMDMYWSQPKEDATTGRTLMGGADYWLRTNAPNNIFTISTMTKKEFAKVMRTVFEFGSSNKMAVFAPILISAIDSWKGDQLRFTPREEFMNIRVADFQSSHGRLQIVEDRLLADPPAGTGNGAGFGGYGFIFDMDNMYYVTFADDDSHLLTDRGPNSLDGEYEEYLADVGLRLDLAKTHVQIKGVTDYTN